MDDIGSGRKESDLRYLGGKIINCSLEIYGWFRVTDILRFQAFPITAKREKEEEIDVSVCGSKWAEEIISSVLNLLSLRFIWPIQQEDYSMYLNVWIWKPGNDQAYR